MSTANLVGGAQRRQPDPVPVRQAGRSSVWTFDRISFFAVFLGIPLVLFVVLVVSPFGQAIYYSFTRWNGFTDEKLFIGFSNYTQLFHDDIFLKALRNSVALGVVVPFVTIIFALTLATVLTVGGGGVGQSRGLKRSSFYRVVSFFPHVVPGIIIGILWAQVYDPASGLLNGVLTKLGLSGFEGFAWLGNSSTAMAASMFAIVWGAVGFYMVLFIAAIRQIDPSLFEAARIDGAGRFRMTMSIVVPGIRDTIQVGYIYVGIMALDSFVYMAALNSSGGPNNSTLVISQDLFQTAFTQGKFGYATAMGVVLAAVTLIYAGIVFAVGRIFDRHGRRRSKQIMVAMAGAA